MEEHGGSRKPKGEQKDQLLDAFAVPMRDSNQIWTQPSSSSVDSVMLLVFPYPQLQQPSLGLVRTQIQAMKLLIWSLMV